MRSSEQLQCAIPESYMCGSSGGISREEAQQESHQKFPSRIVDLAQDQISNNNLEVEVHGVIPNGSSLLDHEASILPSTPGELESDTSILSLVSGSTVGSSQKAEEQASHIHQSHNSQAQFTMGEDAEKTLFIWNEDLSENGRKLYWLLLGDIGFIEWLPELAQSEDIDLVAGIQELRDREVLDENNPKIIRIKR